jgi:type IX secretion system PorP/SprF family membrane protein
MKKLLLIAALFSCKFAISQTNFSQFFNTPLSVNPSNTGRFIGNYRMGGVYRDQRERTSVSSNYCFYADVSILSSIIPENDQMALGVSALCEKNVYAGLKNNSLSVSAAYFKSLNEDGTEKLGAGFQTQFAFKKISPPLLVFQDQLEVWMNNGFTGMNPFERKTFATNYIDFNVGLNYQKLFNTKDLLMIGFSVAHANSPSKNDGDIFFSLSPQFSFQFEFEKKIANSNNLLIALIINNLLNEKISNDYYIASIYQMQINNSKLKLNAGCLYRTNALSSNSIAPLCGFTYKHFNLNCSYDIAFPDKSTNKRTGGLEVSVSYR